MLPCYQQDDDAERGEELETVPEGHEDLRHDPRLKQLRERGRFEHGCQHYKRRCRMVAPCCGEVFWCRHCHNKAKNEEEEARVVATLHRDTVQSHALFPLHHARPYWPHAARLSAQVPASTLSCILSPSGACYGAVHARPYMLAIARHTYGTVHARPYVLVVKRHTVSRHDKGTREHPGNLHAARRSQRAGTSWTGSRCGSWCARCAPTASRLPATAAAARCLVREGLRLARISCRVRRAVDDKVIAERKEKRS